MRKSSLVLVFAIVVCFFRMEVHGGLQPVHFHRVRQLSKNFFFPMYDTYRRKRDSAWIEYAPQGSSRTRRQLKPAGQTSVKDCPAEIDLNVIDDLFNREDFGGANDLLNCADNVCAVVTFLNRLDFGEVNFNLAMSGLDVLLAAKAVASGLVREDVKIKLKGNPILGQELAPGLLDNVKIDTKDCSNSITKAATGNVDAVGVDSRDGESTLGVNPTSKDSKSKLSLASLDSVTGLKTNKVGSVSSLTAKVVNSPLINTPPVLAAGIFNGAPDGVHKVKATTFEHNKKPASASRSILLGLG